MSDNEKQSQGTAVNPHTGQPLPELPPVPEPATGTAGAAAVSAEFPPAAKQVGPPQFSSSPSAQELAVKAMLETVMDPELGLSVIDLGLIREVHFQEGKTLVRMMLTTPFCPYAPQMMADVKQATESAVPQPCEVDILADPWSPDMMPDPGLLGYSY
jgi:metal-sulfur cluster biosynthetic enzyme